MYKLVFAPQAIEDLSILKKSEPAAFKKAGKLLVELQEHLTTHNNPRYGYTRPGHIKSLYILLIIKHDSPFFREEYDLR